MSEKFVLYRRTGGSEDPTYIVASQLHFGEVMNRAHESKSTRTREVLAENDDMFTLLAMRRLIDETQED